MEEDRPQEPLPDRRLGDRRQPVDGPGVPPPYRVGRLAVALRPVARLYDAVDRRWHHFTEGHALGLSLAVVFIVVLLAVELNRHGLLPDGLAGIVGVRHFSAVTIAFGLLLLFEVLALVFTLAQSVANSVGKQFELVSLILLREAFLAFASFGEPIDLGKRGYASLLVVGEDLLAAFLVFVLIGVYYRLQHHQPITPDEREQASFIAAKKAVALALFLAFLALIVQYAVRWLSGAAQTDLFGDFFTILVFADVLIVLVSLAFTSGYHVVFRNAGFAAAAIVVRLALTAPPFVGAALAVAAALFAVALTAAYNSFAPAIRARA